MIIRVNLLIAFEDTEITIFFGLHRQQKYDCIVHLPVLWSPHSWSENGIIQLIFYCAIYSSALLGAWCHLRQMYPGRNESFSNLYWIPVECVRGCFIHRLWPMMVEKFADLVLSALKITNLLRKWVLHGFSSDCYSLTVDYGQSS